ncbi:hypothetical protein [Marinomonas ostreistagni]|uniref:Uncharacterized protein n=1 Tax=Marinomonas ostreistagni TaxID=359209 RepID=A0ABS0Z6D4_9GAMM|nr:hypothetical protein [Marinomonas ostreistagni]MBJ7549189.1 hypothetical protein [Marinomonas ostreistagni]
MYEEAGNSNLLMLLNTAVYPFLAAVIITLLGKVKSHLSLFGLGAGFLVALNLIHSGLNFPPSKALDFLVTAVIFGWLATLVSQLKISKNTQLAVQLVLFGVAFYWLLNPVLQHQSQTISLIWAIASAAAVVLSNQLQLFTASKAHSHAPMASLAIVAGASAPVVAIGGSLLIGQLLGGLAASVVGFILAQRFVIKSSSINGLLLGNMILAGLLAQAHVLADLPFWAMLIAFLAVQVTTFSQKAFTEDGTIARTIIALVPQLLISAFIAGVSLWSVWPESSLY